MMLTEAIRLIITGNSSGAVKSLEQVAVAAGATEKTMGSKMASMNAAASKMVIPFVAMAAIVGKSVLDYTKFGVLVGKVAQQTGMGAEATSRFVGQLQFFHADASRAGMAIKTLEKQIYGLETGTSASVKTFAQLGLTWDDLKNLKPEDQLALIRDRLSQIKDPASRAAAAGALLGRGAKDFALWYGAGADAIAKVNTELEKNGQILSKQQLADVTKAATAWKDFTGAMKGVEYGIARGVLPPLTLLLKGLTELMRLLRPIAPILGPITIGLGVFIGVVKTAVFLQKTWNQLLGLFPARLGAATVAEGGATVATRGFTAALIPAATAIGVVVAALATLAAAYYAAKAASQAFASKRQENAQYKGAVGNLQQAAGKITAWQAAHPGQPLPPDLQKLENTIYSAAQSDVNAHAGASWASGTDHITNGPEWFRAGEAGRERVQITPLNRKNSGGVVVNFIVHGSVVGGKAGMRELSDIVKRDVMGGVQRAMVGQNA